MDNCSLVDSDVNILSYMQGMENLEVLEISIERNRLSNQSSHTFLSIAKIKHLKEIQLYLGGNVFEENFYNQMRDLCKGIRIQLFQYVTSQSKEY